MAKGFATLKISTKLLPTLAIIALSFSACSKNEKDESSGNQFTPSAETFPIENAKLRNCRFRNPAPLYSYNSAIEANPILCDEGVATKVQLLSPSPLPAGLQFTQDQLSLTGTAKERVVNAPYEFYIENAAGYAIIRLVITVR